MLRKGRNDDEELRKTETDQEGKRVSGRKRVLPDVYLQPLQEASGLAAYEKLTG